MLDKVEVEVKEVIFEKKLPIYHSDKYWVVRIYKDRALYIVQCGEGNLTYEEIAVVNDIIFDPSFMIKLQKIIDNLDIIEQTKKDEGLKLGVYLTMKGIKKQEIADKLVKILEDEVEFKKSYIAQNIMN